MQEQTQKVRSPDEIREMIQVLQKSIVFLPSQHSGGKSRPLKDMTKALYWALGELSDGDLIG